MVEKITRAFKKKRRKFIGLIICCIFTIPPSYGRSVLSQPGIAKQTFTYAEKDTSRLELDIYSLRNETGIVKKPCVIFVFGGAFIGGRRDDTIYHKYFECLALHDYVVVSISYRLGLKGTRQIGLFNTAPLKNAIDMAVEDVYDATNWLTDHAEALGIDTSKIILSGSSAGAVTVLQAGYEKDNNTAISGRLPKSFKYAAIISFSGAILSYNGKPHYGSKPSPVLLFYGTADKIMPQNKIRFFNKGLYGSSYIADIYKENGFAYYVHRSIGMGHEIAVLPMVTKLDVILDFLNNYVMNGKHYQVDVAFKDPDQQPLLTISAKQLFEKLQHQETGKQK